MEPSMIAPPSTHMATNTHFTSSSGMEAKSEVRSVQPVKYTQENQSVPEKKPDLKEVSREFNEMSDTLNLDVKFAYNDKINEIYINVTDKNTGKVIRKLPSEEAMKLKESMQDLVGVLFDKKG